MKLLKFAGAHSNLPNLQSALSVLLGTTLEQLSTEAEIRWYFPSPRPFPKGRRKSSKAIIASCSWSLARSR